MEVSTVSQKTITGVDIYLTLDEAQHLRTLLGVANHWLVNTLYVRLGRALDEAREANAQS